MKTKITILIACIAIGFSCKKQNNDAWWTAFLAWRQKADASIAVSAQTRKQNGFSLRFASLRAETRAVVADVSSVCIDVTDTLGAVVSNGCEALSYNAGTGQW